jgi:regulator of protease activity HflC (stomatin/prohibitin superfamily)
MTRYIRIDNVRRQMTAEEEAAKDADEAQNAIYEQAKAEAVAQKATDKASAKAKLIAGEALTQAEADTIVI